MQKLPVYQHRHRILKLLRKSQVIVVESPTGSGKTTQLPIILYNAGFTQKGIIGITQPRRIAAISIAQYIHNHIPNKNPQYVAHKIRFEDNTTAQTRIKVMTDGTLLQEIKHDPLLSTYAVIMIDEAHERSTTIDFILGLLKRLLSRRPDLKIIISSATINAQIFSDYFDKCPIVYIKAKSFPVERTFRNVTLSNTAELVEHVTKNIADCYYKKPGDILVFLPGEQEIKACANALRSKKYYKHLQVQLLYARMRNEEQKAVFLPTEKNKTKIILTTNIAETSITIEGIVHVIDSGIVKLNFYDGKKHTSTLLTSSISQASADQRKGRAGRTQKGYCVHLFSEKDYMQRPRYTLEEIKRSDLAEVVLRMADISIQDFETFDFISAPHKPDIISAVKYLKKIHALDDNRYLTSLGKLMLEFPLSPYHSKIVVTSMIQYPEVLHGILIVTSFLTSQQPFLLPLDQEREARIAHSIFSSPQGDFTTWITLFHRFRNTKDSKIFCQKHFLDEQIMNEIINVYEQLKNICNTLQVSVLEIKTSYHKLMHCMMHGLIDNIYALRKTTSYHNSSNTNIYIHPGSVLWGKSPQFIVAGEITKTTRTYARSVGTVHKEWIKEINHLLLSQLKAGKNIRTRKEKRNKNYKHPPNRS